MRIFLSILLFNFSVFAISQSNIWSLGLLSNEQEFIKLASDSAIFILRQDYILRDTVKHKDYTLNDQPFFGRVYSLAFLTDSILWTDSRILTPWIGDTNFDYYRSRYLFVPVLTDLYCRPIYSRQFEKIEYSRISPDRRLDSILNNNSMVLLKQNKYTKYLTPQYNTLDETGWALIIYTEMKISECDTCQVKYAIFKALPDFSNSGILARQPALPYIIGGIYLLPFIKTGTIHFYVAGFIRKISNFRVTPLVDIRSYQNGENPPENVPSPENDTPNSSSKRGRKNK